jgi:hypothetical protein
MRTKQMNRSRAVPIAAVGAVMLVIGLVAGSLAFGRTESTTKVLTTTTTVIENENTTASTSSCTNPPSYPATPCPYVFSFSFPISITYSGSWNMSYQGYYGSSPPYGRPSNVSGSDTGSGNYNRTITLTGGIQELTLCALAKKLDSSSNQVLTLIVDQRASSTSQPYRETTVCETVAP